METKEKKGVKDNKVVVEANEKNFIAVLETVKSRTKNHLYVLKQFAENVKRIKESGLLGEEEKQVLDEVNQKATTNYISGQFNQQ